MRAAVNFFFASAIAAARDLAVPRLASWEEDEEDVLVSIAVDLLAMAFI